MSTTIPAAAALRIASWPVYDRDEGDHQQRRHRHRRDRDPPQLAASLALRAPHPNQQRQRGGDHECIADCRGHRPNGREERRGHCPRVLDRGERCVHRFRRDQPEREPQTRRDDHHVGGAPPPIREVVAVGRQRADQSQETRTRERRASSQTTATAAPGQRPGIDEQAIHGVRLAGAGDRDDGGERREQPADRMRRTPHQKDRPDSGGREPGRDPHGIGA